MSRTGAKARANANHAWAEKSAGEHRGMPVWPCTRCPAQKLSYREIFRASSDDVWSSTRPRCTGWEAESLPASRHAESNSTDRSKE